MDQDIEGFVETSTNLASVKTVGKQIKIVTSQRSSIESKKDDAANMVASAFELMGAEVEFGDGYPGWMEKNREIYNSLCKIRHFLTEIKASL